MDSRRLFLYNTLLRLHLSSICNDYGRLGSIGVDYNAVQYDFFDP